MNLKLIKLLGLVSAGLLFILLCEWLYAVYAQNRLLTSISEANKKNMPMTTLPTLELGERPESSYADLVARPLFIPGRKPVAEPETDAKPVPTSSDTFDWALNGIYTYKQTLYALFSRTNKKVPKDNYRKISKDGEIDGWKLTEIQYDKVVVSQGEKRKELLLRKPKPKDASNNPNTRMHNAPPGVPPVAPLQPVVPGQQEPVPIPEPDLLEEPIPEQDLMPEPEPEPIIEPDPGLLPEPIIPDETGETNFENSANEQFQ